MRAFLAAVFALLAVIVLTTSAEESKGHEEDKRMLYWKRDSPFDSEEDLDEMRQMMHYLNPRPRLHRLRDLRKRMLYW
uniref:Uncharacterized protein n=1 Tax=Mesocestoides corti TaxID=53468 RepID=A0A5K3G0D9_MESCO